MDEERLRRVADILTDGDGRPLLGRLLVACLELLAMTGAGIAVIGDADGQHRGAVAVSDPATAAVDDLQFSLGEGPCVDANRSAAPVLEPDLAQAVGQWPAFAPAALAQGIGAVFSFPLRMGAVRLGVLSLYRETPGDLGPEVLADAMTMSRIATHLLLELEAETTPGLLPDRLAEVAGHRAVVHQATGMIAAQLDSNVATALARLRSYAWANGRSIDGVAAEVVARLLRFDTPWAQ
jgi:GAF domain/ANTAR domain